MFGDLIGAGEGVATAVVSGAVAGGVVLLFGKRHAVGTELEELAV